MRSSVALAALAASLATAQTTTLIQMWNAAMDDEISRPDQTLHASVVGVKPGATTLALQCVPKPTPAASSEDLAGPDECHDTAAFTIVEGPSTLYASIVEIDGDGTTATAIYDYSAIDKTSITVIVSAEEVSDGMTSTLSYGTALKASFTQNIPVLVTAGAEKLAASPARASGVATETAAGTHSSFVTRAPTAVASASAGVGGNSTTVVGNGAGSVNAQNALVAGFAALVGGVFLL